MSSDEVTFCGYGLSLRISQNTINVWKGFRQMNVNDPESFGVIIGSRTEDSDEYWVDRVTKPLSKDRATRCSFLLQDINHQKTVDMAFDKSNGTKIYLGTWHTHPEEIPTPSSIDRRDWLACIKRNPKKQLFFVIIGLDEIRVYVRRYFILGFGRLKEENG